MKRKYLILAASVLVAVILVSFLLAFEPRKQLAPKPFYVGVEFAFGSQFSQLKAMVDQAKNYTNLFVIGSVTLTFNLTALNESAKYIFDAGLSFIVLFTSFYMYNSNGWSERYTIFNWTREAQSQYGRQFLGIYRFDEPGGNQIDHGRYQLVNDTALSYSQVAQNYVGNLASIVHYYAYMQNTTPEPSLKIFTSDYALYWFDYQAGYNTIFAELVGNHTRQIPIALDRGAAQSFNQSWGVIVTWDNEFPRPENKTQLLGDLSMAYEAGASYAIVFPFPSNVTGTNDTYWTLPQEDFDALQTFWADMHSTPARLKPTPSEQAYVVPVDFGFGFRNGQDTIWGLFPAANDPNVIKIWGETQILMEKHPSELNIIFDNQTIIQPTLHEYTKVYYYNRPIG